MKKVLSAFAFLLGISLVLFQSAVPVFAQEAGDKWRLDITEIGPDPWWKPDSVWYDRDPLFLPEFPGGGTTIHCGVGYNLYQGECVSVGLDIGGFYQNDPYGDPYEEHGFTVGLSFGFGGRN